MQKPEWTKLESYVRYPESTMEVRSEDFCAEMLRRRTVRQFSSEPVSRSVIENCLRAAASAPSGANLQPWHFVVVGDPETRKQIRNAAEKEEHEFYHHRASPEWLEALAPLGTDEHKPYLERAPFLIVIFSRSYTLRADGTRLKHYYVNESVGIATGILITAIHHAGLVSLTHTPSPMGFLNRILGRPKEERPYLILVTGYPEKTAVIPNIPKKTLDEVVTFV